MSQFGLRGEKVVLVPLDQDKHLDNFVRWFNDPQVTRWLLITLPLMKLAEVKWFERAAESTTDAFFAVEDLNGVHIGSTGIHHIDWKCGTGTTGIVIGNPDYWGKGFGYDVMRVRTRYAFETLGLRRLESQAFVENAASRRCLEKVGYKLVGVEPEKLFRNGAYRDLAVYYYLSKAYFEAQQQA